MKKIDKGRDPKMQIVCKNKSCERLIPLPAVRCHHCHTPIVFHSENPSLLDMPFGPFQYNIVPRLSFRDIQRCREVHPMLQNQIDHSDIIDQAFTFTEKFSVLHTYRKPQNICSLVILPKNILISGSRAGIIKIWDTRDGKCIRTLNEDAPEKRKKNESSMFSATSFFTAPTSACMNTVRMPRTHIRATARVWNEELLTLDAFPRGLVISGHKRGKIKVWNINSRHKNCMKTFSISAAHDICSMKVFKNNFVAVGDEDGSIHVLDINRAKANIIRTLDAHTSSVNSLVFFHHNESLVSGSLDGTIRFWNILYNEKSAKTLRAHSPVTSLVGLPDGLHLASGHLDNSIALWNIKDERCIKRWMGEHATHKFVSGINCLSPLGHDLLAVGSNNYKTIKVWNLNNTCCVGTLTGHKAGLCCLASSQDGYFISGDRRSIIKKWRKTSLRELMAPDDQQKGTCCIVS